MYIYYMYIYIPITSGLITHVPLLDYIIMIIVSSASGLGLGLGDIMMM